MSKVDAMRALREAKHARGGALPDSPGAARTSPGAARPRATAAGSAAPAPATGTASEPEPTAVDELCGHRNMGGKSCSRPAGHTEKNHRYR